MTLPIEELDPVKYSVLWSEFRGLETRGYTSLGSPNFGLAGGRLLPGGAGRSVTPGPKGLIYSAADGYPNLYLSPNSSQLSFGQTVNDAPFSICVFQRYTQDTPGASTCLIGRSGPGAAVEYGLFLAAGVATFRMYQTGNPAIYLSRQVTSGYYGEFGGNRDVLITVTYGGPAPANRIRIYYDDRRVDDADSNAGAYTRMGNTATLFSVGAPIAAIAPHQYVGIIYSASVYPFELTQGQAAYLATRARQERWV